MEIFKDYNESQDRKLRIYTFKDSRYESNSFCFENSALKKIKIPKKITTIPRNAFSGCENIKSIGFLGSGADVEIPYNLTTIGEFAFAYTGIVNLVIPNSITTISGYAFSYCDSLENVTIPNSVISISYTAFKDCNNIENVNLDSDINSTIFKSLSGLTTVTIGNNVTYLTTGCFQGCSNLTTVTINSGSNLRTIYDNAFANCVNLETINIPNTVTKIGSAFNGCTSLPVENGLRYADTCVVEAVDNSSTYTIKEGTRIIGSNGIFGKSNLINLVMPNSVAYIEYAALANNSNLESVTMSNSIVSIGVYAFNNCPKLTSITIPSTTKEIGYEAFRQCSRLSSVTVLAVTPPTLGSNVFALNANNRKIYVPAESVDIYKAANGWSTYASAIEAIPVYE